MFPLCLTRHPLGVTFLWGRLCPDTIEVPVLHVFVVPVILWVSTFLWGVALERRMCPDTIQVPVLYVRVSVVSVRDSSCTG